MFPTASSASRAPRRSRFALHTTAETRSSGVETPPQWRHGNRPTPGGAVPQALRERSRIFKNPCRKQSTTVIRGKQRLERIPRRRPTVGVDRLGPYSGSMSRAFGREYAAGFGDGCHRPRPSAHAENAAAANGCRDVALLAGPVGVMLVRHQMLNVEAFLEPHWSADCPNPQRVDRQRRLAHLRSSHVWRSAASWDNSRSGGWVHGPNARQRTWRLSEPRWSADCPNPQRVDGRDGLSICGASRSGGALRVGTTRAPAAIQPHCAHGTWRLRDPRWSADCPNPQRVDRQRRLAHCGVPRSGGALRVGTTRAPAAGFMPPMRGRGTWRLSQNLGPERGQRCPREPADRNSRTRLSALRSAATVQEFIAQVVFSQCLTGRGCGRIPAECPESSGTRS